MGHDTESGSEVALKVIYPDAADGDALVERFWRQARSAASLHHTHILPVTAYDVVTAGDRRIAYLAAPFIEGHSLEEELARLQVSGGKLSQERALAILRAVAAALDYAHRRGVTHLDLKPANILLGPKGEPAVTDFGLGATLGMSGREGPDPYRAPELTEDSPTDARADVYSLGAIAYHLLVGHSPPASEASAVPGQETAPSPVLLRALHPDPAQRFRTAAELVAALEHSLKASPEFAQAPPEAAAVATPPPTSAQDGRPGSGPEGSPAKPAREGIRQFLVQILAIFTAVMALIDKFIHAVGLLRNPLVGLVVVGIGVGAMVLSAGYVLARPRAFTRRQRILAAGGLTITLLAAAGWGGWTVYDMTRPPKGLIVLISSFDRVPGSKSVDYARRIEAGLNQALAELGVEGVYVERVDEVYTESDARRRAASRKAAIVIYGWYDDAGVNPRFELVNAPQQYAPIVRQSSAGLASLDHLEVRLDKELRELSYLATATIGLVYFADGQDAQALSFFDAALQSVPGEAVLMGKEAILLYKASCHFNLYAFDQAVAALEAAVAINGEFYEARRNLAIAYNAYCNPNGALEQSREAVRLRPDSADAHVLHGLLLSADNRWQEAASSLAEAVRLDPTDAAAHSALAEALFHLGREQEAEAEYAEAARLAAEPTAEADEPQAIAAKGDIRLSQGDVDGALAEYRRAIERAESLGLRRERLAWLYRSLGMGYWEKEDWAEMAAAYGQAAAMAPGLYSDHVSLGIAYEHLGDLEQAQAHFETAVARQPCNANARGLLGNLYLQRGQLDEALAEYRAAVESDPDDFTAWNSIAEILEQQGRPEEAKAAYEQAAQGARTYLAGDPHNAGVAYMLGAISFMLEDYDGARQAAELAVSLNPDSAGHYLLASVYYMLHEYGRSVAEYQAVLQLEPEHVAALTGLAEAYEAMGETQAAISSYSRLLAIEDDPYTRLSLAALYEATNDVEAAVAQYQAALAALPDEDAEEPIRIALAGALSKLCRLDEARATLDSLGGDGTPSAQYLATLAGLQEAQGDPAGAATTYSALLSAYPDLAGAHYLVAWFHYRQGRLDEAIAEADRAVSLMPTFALGWSALGQFQDWAGDLAAAETSYRTSLAHMPDDSTAYLGLGAIALQRGDPQSALDYLREALEHEPAYSAALPDPAHTISVSIRIYLGLAYQHLGREAEARREFEEAVRLSEEAVAALPDYARATHQLGVALYAAGREEEAGPYLEAAIGCDASMAAARDRALARIATLRPR